MGANMSVKTMSANLLQNPQSVFNGAVHNGASNREPPGHGLPARVLFAAADQSAHAPPPCAPGDVSMADWHDLLNAVKARLLLTASEDFVESRGQRLERTLEMVQTEMIDCVAALDQLHTTLSNELERHKNLQHGIEAAQAALARKHSELTGTQAQERRSRHLGHHDSLTALPNRRYFCQRLDQALAQQLESAERQMLAVLFLELEHFKQINDTHGHAAGDEVLKTVATRLAQHSRSEDSVSRLVGDEFACLLGGFPDRQRLGLYATEVLAAVAAPIWVGGLSLTVYPSIGIAMFPGDGLTSLALLQHADAAMHVAKKNRSGYAFYDELAQR